MGESALMLAARNGNEELVRFLLAAGAIDKASSFYGKSALSEVARLGYGSIVRHLLEVAPPTNRNKGYLKHALQIAVNSKHGDIVQDLLTFGADAYAGDMLSSALRWSSCAIVQILLRAGGGLDHVQRDLMVELFAARDGEAQRHGFFFEASAKSELLIRTFS
jgi:ankyrin repeat protein